jgi:hypothetical protein
LFTVAKLFNIVLGNYTEGSGTLSRKVAMLHRMHNEFQTMVKIEDEIWVQFCRINNLDVEGEHIPENLGNGDVSVGQV